MGSTKKAATAAAVCMAMMLAFAVAVGVGPLAPQPVSGGAIAATGVAALEISADGATALGDSVTLSVGESLSVGALGVAGGDSALIPAGAASWSLASDGAAALSANDGDLVVTVVALAAGDAGLYVTTDDGLVDLVNISVVDGKSAEKVASSINITNPKDGTTYFIEQGITGIPLTMTSRVDDPNGTAVTYSYDNTQVTAFRPPFAATIPDISGFTQLTIQAAAGSYSDYNNQTKQEVTDTASITITAIDADTDGDGRPDNPFGLGLTGDNAYSNVVDISGKKRVLTLKLLTASAKGTSPVPPEGTVLTAADPDDTSRQVSVTIPGGLILAGEQGIAVLQVADDLATLVGAAGTDTIVTSQPSGGVVTNALYAEVSILVSTDGGSTFSEIDNARLTANPIEVDFSGTANAATDPVDVFSFSTAVTGPPINIAVDGTAWVREPTTVELNGATGIADTLSVFAPFVTTGDLAISTIANTTANSLNGTPQAYAGGGGTITVDVLNANAAPLSVFIDGQAASASQADNGANATLTVTVPAADVLASAAASKAVDVTVTGGANDDTAPGGLTFVGPRVDSINPISGSASGGDPVTIAGEGFAAGLSAALGGNAISGIAVPSGTSVTGTTGPGTAGQVALTVTLGNNYQGTLANAFTYLPAQPVLTSVTPDTVYDDGGYRVRLTGMNFLAEGTTFGTLAKGYMSYAQYTQKVLFAQTANTANEAVDDPAAAITFIDDTRIDAVTPSRAAGTSDVYVSNAALASMAKGAANYRSQLVDFTFLDDAAAPFTITNIDPDSGPNTGGTSVSIQGDGWPTAKDSLIKVEQSKGTAGFAHQIRVVNQTVTQGGDFTVELVYVRGDNAVADEGPSAINFELQFDANVITPNALSNTTPNNPTTNTSLLLLGKSLQAGLPDGQNGSRVTFVLAGGTTELLPTTTPPVGDPLGNPISLGTFSFNASGTSGAQTALTVANVSMADAAAVQLAGVTGQDGRVCIDSPTPCEFVAPPAAVDVFFGPNQATVTGQKQASGVTVSSPSVFTSGDPLLESATLFPMTGYNVDVRVQAQSDTTMFAISKAASSYNSSPPAGNRGFIYNLVTAPTITGFTPTEGWMFGGQKVTISISGYSGVTPQNTTVTFGNDVAPILSANDTEVVVVAPTTTAAGTPSVSTPITVSSTGAKQTQTDTTDTATNTPDQYTFHRVKEVNETVGTTTAAVTVNAFAFDSSQGGSFDLVYNANAPKQNTDTTDGNTDTPGTNTFVSVETGSVTFPPLPGAKGLGSTVFGILRASKSTVVSGADNLTTAPNQVGNPIGNIWNFDLHLYTDQYNATNDGNDELTGISFNTDSAEVVRITFPTDDTLNPGLTQTDLETGGVALYSTVGGTYNPRFGATSYMPVATVPRFQDTTALENATIGTDGSVDTITNIDLFDISQSSFTLVLNSFPPRSAVTANVVEEAGEPIKIVPVEGGEQVDITGTNIAWTTNVVFTSTAKQGQSASVAPTNPGADDQLISCIAPASPTGGETLTNVFLEITVRDGTKQNTTALIPAGQVQFGTGIGRQFPLLQLLAGLIAALGLLAGGDSGGGGGGPCFIATAAYGTPMAGEIDTLRAVRDAYLLDNAVGATLVDGYYRVSPAVADAVAQSPALATAVRIVLVPVTAIGKLVMAMPYVSLTLTIAAMAMFALRRRAKGHKA